MRLIHWNQPHHHDAFGVTHHEYHTQLLSTAISIFDGRFGKQQHPFQVQKIHQCFGDDEPYIRASSRCSTGSSHTQPLRAFVDGKRIEIATLKPPLLDTHALIVSVPPFVQGSVTMRLRFETGFPCALVAFGQRAFGTIIECRRGQPSSMNTLKRPRTKKKPFVAWTASANCHAHAFHKLDTCTNSPISKSAGHKVNRLLYLKLTALS